MSRLLKHITVGTAMGGVGLLLLGLGCYAAGVRVNTTKSIPLGVYLTSSKPIEKGDYVWFCPPRDSVFVDARERGYLAAGFCPGNFSYMMKRVLAAEGDAIKIDMGSVRINGVLLPLSTALKVDQAGRALPSYQTDHYTLGSAEVLLMSDVSATSFDGRYFGPINRSQIKTVITPFITW